MRGNPLSRAELARALAAELPRYGCAIVLCDAVWLDPDRDGGNGIEMREQQDFLRLDAMVLMVQLNLRQMLAVRAPPPAADTAGVWAPGVQQTCGSREARRGREGEGGGGG